MKQRKVNLNEGLIQDEKQDYLDQLARPLGVRKFKKATQLLKEKTIGQAYKN